MNNYFPLDSDMRNSEKEISLRMEMGAEGYGIYIMLLERLRNQPDYISPCNYSMLSFDLRAEEKKIRAVVEDFNLFLFTDDGKNFYSELLMQSMRCKEEKSEKARELARKRWDRKSEEESVEKRNEEAKSESRGATKHCSRPSSPLI